MALRDRLRALELRAAGDTLLVIVINGGLPEGEEPLTAEAAGHQWTQSPNESPEAFKVRIRKAAEKLREKLVVIGGLSRVT